MRRIVQNSNRHPLTSRQNLVTNGYTCAACSKGKLIISPSFTKVTFESLAFLECIQGDICGPIHPSSGPFRYFMVLIDASLDGLMYALFLVEMLPLLDYWLK